MKKIVYLLTILFQTVTFVSAQTITFDDQGHTHMQALPNPYLITNNGEQFRFSVSNGGAPIATTHTYKTTENGGCGTTAVSHIDAGSIAATTWTIETVSGSEIDLGTIRFDNIYSCFAFNYDLSIEGFKNTVSTGAAQLFSVTGLNSTFTSNANFNDVDKIVITCANLGVLGIDNINWVPVAPACSDPNITSFTSADAVICSGGSTTLTVAGALNDATAWHLYTGSCGGTAVTSNATGSFSVSPITTTTYYVRGEDGAGCVTEAPGSCSEVTVIVANTATTSTIVFDDQGYVNNQDLGNPYTHPAATNGSSLRFRSLDASKNLISEGMRYSNVNGGCPADGAVDHLSPGPGSTPIRYVTIASTNGEEFDLTSINFQNTFSPSCFVFQYNITIEGFKNGVSTGAGVAHTVVNNDNIFTAGVNFNDVDSIVISEPSNMAAMGIDDIIFKLNTLPCGASCTDPDVPSALSATPSTVCPSANSTISWTGSLNDATAWHIYTGGCGTTPLTTTASNSLVVSPTSTTTYYIRGEDGAGCVDESSGSCGTVTVTVNTNSTITSATASTNNICPSTAVNLTANGVTTGTGATLTWYTGAGGTGSNLGTGNPKGVTPATTTTYYARLAGTCNTVEQSVTVTVDKTNSAITSVTSSANNVCPSTAVNMTANGVTTGTGATLTWYTGAGGTGSNLGTGNPKGVTPATTTTYYARLAGTCNTVEQSATVTVTDVTAPTAVCQNITIYLDGAGNASIVAADVDNGSSDNCGTPTLSLSQSAFTCADLGANSVTLTATDGSSNTDNCTATVTVLDTIAPSVTCPGNQTQAVDASCGYTLADYTGLMVTSDNCTGSPVVTQSPVSGTSQSGTTMLTLYSTDGSGNVDSCSFNVLPNDLTAPTAVCQNLTIYLDGAGNASIVAADVDNGSSDNCGTPTLSLSKTAFTCVDLGANSVKLYAEDGAGNKDSCTATITVQDTNSPVASCQNITVYLDGAGNASIVAADVDNGSSDNCGVPTLGLSKTSFTCADIGANSVTLTATDGSSNSSTCTATVTIADTISPTAVCQNITVYLDGAGNASITASDIDNGSSDNCGSVALGASKTSFTCTDLGANSVTLTATDGSGNAGNCSATVTVMDTVAPTASCQNITIYLNGAGNASIVATDVDNGSSDNCGTPTLNLSKTAFTCADLGANSVTLTATDGGGNTDNCTATVTVLDTIAPSVTCPGNQTQAVDASCGYTLADYTGLMVTSDNCTGSPVVTQSPVSGTSQSGTTTVTLYSTDGSGNVDSCSFNVLPNDVTKPTAICQNVTLYLDAAGNATLTTGDVDNGSSDNCGISIMSLSQTAFTCANLGVNNVDLIVTDASGNADTCTATITVMDSIAPTANCQNITVYLNGAGNASIVAADVDNGSSDNCSIGSSSLSKSAFTCSDAGANSVTLTITDGSGNVDSCMATVTVLDTISPTTICQNINVYLDGAGNASITASDIDNGSSDNCGSVALGASKTSFTCTDLGANSVTLTATDGSGNAGNCSATVTVMDTVAPTASCQNITIYLDGAGNASIVAADVDNGSSDNCGTPTLSLSQSAFTCADLGANSVTLTATDGGGNTDNCTATVTVLDTIAPSVTCPGNQTQAVDASCGYTLADYTGLMVTSDNCTGSPVVTQSPVSGTSQSGTTTVTLYSTDGSGNVDSCSFNVLPVDTSAPTITCLANQVLNADSICQASLPDYSGMVTATDNCGTLTITQSPASGTLISTTTTITMYAQDATGNIDSCSFDVSITDATAPTIACPTTQTEIIDSNCQYILGDYTALATVSDNCDAAPVVTQSPASGTASSGTTVVTIFATDATGNVDSCSFNVMASDTTDPIITCPASISSCDNEIFYTEPTFSDNCTGATMAQTDASGLTSGDIFPLGTTSLTYTVTDAGGNTASCSFDVTVLDLPVIDAGPDEMIDKGVSVNINASSSGNYSYSWTPATGLSDATVLNPDASPTETTIYTLTATSTDSCVASDSMMITVNPGLLIINNVITPNNDGKNDTWIIDGMPFAGGCRVQVFNRWGTLVFESNNYQNEWDGTFNGNPLPEGAYFYVLTCDEDTEEITGSVTILRLNN